VSSDEKNVSEQLFERYLHSQGIDNFEHHKQFIGKKKHPDYWVCTQGREFIFEVKEFKAAPFPSTFSYDPIRPIREKLKEAQKQFKEYKEWPCGLVLYNLGNPLASIENAFEMLGSMHDELSIPLELDIEKHEAESNSKGASFGSGGYMIQPNWKIAQNKTFSALITLRYIQTSEQEKHLGVMVFENIFARIRFPSDLFCGEYDIRYGRDGQYITSIYVGKGLPGFQII
jgi:hypothetical protein